MERDGSRWVRRIADHRARTRARGADHAVVLAYDGRRFAGWARQPERRTLEGCLRGALEPWVPGLRRVAVAGRTDRGVSALGQVVSFRADTRLDLDRIGAEIDAAAPGELLCLRARHPPRGFHAQFWARARAYTYLYPASPELWARAAVIDRRLRALIGRRCFRAFSRETPVGRTTVRHLLAAGCRPGHWHDRPVLRFEFRADGFLRRLVRVLVATAVESGFDAVSDSILRDLAASGDRSRTASPASPEPLFFLGPQYDGWMP